MMINYWIKNIKMDTEPEIYRTFSQLPQAGKLKFRANQAMEYRKIIVQMKNANYLSEDEYDFIKYTRSRLIIAN